MKKLAAYCVLLSLLVGAVAGCGMGKRKYVGTYVAEQGGSVLELKSDGTYRYEASAFGFRQTNTGEWQVEKYDGNEVISLLGAHPLQPSAFERSKKTGNLYNVFGETFVKRK